ncbi:putative sugar kinase YdjH [Abditibacteriota bacterium]|nr:putative sugar kinase YdjH [Abditibacteriota bacterium]
MSEVVCLGILVADIIGRPIDAVPPRGALQLVESIAPFIGGCAANTGIGLQKLGVETLVAGRIGRDGLGDFLRAEIERAGVKTQLSCDERAATSATMVLVASDGERSFLHSTGANATLKAEHFDSSVLDGARLLHIAGHGLLPSFDGLPCATLLQQARRRAVLTSLDTAGAPDATWRGNLRACLPHLDFFLPSLHEVKELFPDIQTPEAVAMRLLEEGVGTVALKMGGEGAFVHNGREAHHVPPFAVQSVDATGAGDAFAAGFLAGILRGFDLKRCAKLGNACGALCVTQIGTVSAARSLEETLEYFGL